MLREQGETRTQEKQILFLFPLPSSPPCPSWMPGAAEMGSSKEDDDVNNTLHSHSILWLPKCFHLDCFI